MENNEINKDWKKCTEECTCEGPGYCPRYNIHMNPYLHNLCKTDITWRYNFQNFFAPAKNKEEQEFRARKLEEQNAAKNHNELLDQAIQEVEEAGVNLENYEDKSAGLGDLIGGIFSKLGITEEITSKWAGIAGCGCNKRKKFLNKIFPFREKE